jgi:hypothetical protein
MSLFKELYARFHYEYNHFRPMYHYIQKKDDMIIAEIGVGEGENALHILKYFDVETLVLIDPYKSFESNGYVFTQDEMIDLRNMAHKRLSGYNDRIIWKDLPSNVACKHFSPGYFDLIYVDGIHTFPGCYDDIINYFPLVKNGGYIGGHDFMEPGVMYAVSLFCYKTGNKMNFLKCDWWIKKT